MDPSNFDIDRHVIPFIPSVTKLKKKIKRDRDELLPDKVLKQSKRFERGKQKDVPTRTLFKHKVDSCLSADDPCQAAV